MLLLIDLLHLRLENFRTRQLKIRLKKVCLMRKFLFILSSCKILRVLFFALLIKSSFLKITHSESTAKSNSLIGGEKEGGEDTAMVLGNNSAHIQETSKSGFK